MNRINLTNGELAALAARIQRNYDYDDRSGLLVNKHSLLDALDGWEEKEFEVNEC